MVRLVEYRYLIISTRARWHMIKFKIRAPECTRTHHFYVKNSKIFWGGVVPQREGDTPSQTHPPQRLRRLDLHASLTHPTRKSGYGLTGGASNSLAPALPKNRLRVGLHLQPAGELMMLPRPRSRLERCKSLTQTHPTDAFGMISHMSNVL